MDADRKAFIISGRTFVCWFSRNLYRFSDIQEFRVEDRYDDDDGISFSTLVLLFKSGTKIDLPAIKYPEHTWAVVAEKFNAFLANCRDTPDENDMSHKGQGQTQAI